jgi:hypothetical protein
MSSTVPTKIAVLFNRLNYNLSLNSIKGFVELIGHVSQRSRYVILQDSELHGDNAEAAVMLPDNVYYSIPGIINADVNQIFNGSFFNQVKSLYSQLPDKLNKLNPYVPKAKMFDVLLGTINRPNRNFVYNNIIQYHLTDQVILSRQAAKEFNLVDFILEPGVNIVNDIYFSGSHVDYYGVSAPLFCIVPIEIYNQTAYSIVTETNSNNEFSFFTEKIVKPILARRLFVVFSGYKFLHNLRQIGFQTFDNIIDESYDLIIDPVERFTQAFEQVKRLCSMPQDQVLEKIKIITEHNYNMICTRDFSAESYNQIIGKINEHN